MRRPLFTIVIPTRDRAALLAGAVRSALAQTHDDFEVLVSDNASADGTPDLLRRLADTRLRVVRTPRPLLMHESWRFAIERSRGERIALLCDDDALRPDALACAEAAFERGGGGGAEVVFWRSCSWRALDWHDRAERGRVRFGPPFTGREIDVDGARLLDLAYGLRVTLTDLVPKMLNTVVSRAVLERAAADGAPLFLPSCPDYASMLVLAAYARRIVMLDAPLLVAGATPMSIGASALSRGEAARRFLEELRAGEPDLLLPDAVGTMVTWLGQTFMQCAARVPALAGRVVDRIAMYGLADLDIRRAETRGEDVADLRAALDAALAGPLAADARAIAAFAAADRDVESEDHLRPRPDAPLVNGLGARQIDDADPTETGWATIDEVASGLPAWIRERSCALDDLWPRLADRARERHIVLFGLGRNARALLRLRALTAPHPERPLAYDDRGATDLPDTEPLRSFDALDPARHFVLITPTDAASITERLRARGFAPGRDMAQIRSRVESLSTANRQTAVT